MKRRFPFKLVITLLVLAGLAVGGFYAFRYWRQQQNAAAITNLQTVAASRGDLTSTVGATGTVRSNQTAILTWQINGTVGMVKAHLGDQVEADEVLAELDPMSLPQSIVQAQADLIQAQNALDDLLEPPSALKLAQAEVALKDAQTALDNLLTPSDLALAQADQAVLDAQDAVDTAQRDVNRLTYARGDQAQINSARANYLLAQEHVDAMQGIYNNTPGNSSEDAAKAQALSNLEGAKTARDRALATLNWYLGIADPEEVAETETRLALAQAQLADAQKVRDDLQNPDPVDVALAEERVADAQEALDTLNSGPTQDDITIAETRIKLAQATLDQVDITAPFAGTITQVDTMPGDQATPGRAAFQLDDLSRLLVEVGIAEVDINQIEVGQPVLLTFDAILGKEYHGVVTEVGEVGTIAQGVVSFNVTVELTDPDEDVKPGMTAAVNITVNELVDVLLIPNRAVRVLDGKRVVYLLQNGLPTAVEITLGASSDTVSEVVDGDLAVGDLIILNPTVNLFQGPGGGGMMFGGN